MANKTTILAYFVSAVIFIGYATLERSHSVRDEEFGLAEIEILNPVAFQIIDWSVFLVFLTLLVLSSISFKTNWLWRPGIGLAIALAMYPFSLFSHTVHNLGPWTTYGQLVNDAGQTFVFCDSSFLQGQTMAITEVSATGVFKTKYRVLVSNNGDSPRSWASVIRPEGSSDEYGQLYLNNGYLLGIRFDNRCYLAYQLVTETAYGHGDIESISPFACLSHSDTLNAVDIQRTCDRINKYIEYCESSDDIRPAEGFLNGEFSAGCPDRSHLHKTAESPGIKSAANALNDCYNAGGVKLKERVTKEPKSKNAT